MFESGAIRLPRREVGVWVEQLEEELLQFPRAASDDVLDALWIALQAVEAQRVEPRILFSDDIPESDYNPSKSKTRSCYRCGGANKLSAILCDSCGRRLGWDD